VTLGLRILHVLDSGGLYGAEVVVLELATEQHRLGHRPAIVSIGTPKSDEKPIEREARQRQIEVFPVRMAAGFNLLGMRRLVKLAREQSADVMHAHGYKPDILLGFVPRRLRRGALVTTIHGYTHTGGLNRMAVYGWLDRRALGRMDGVVLVHDGMRAVQGLDRLHDPRWRVIENGIPVNPAAVPRSALDPRLLAFCGARPVVGAVGRLSREKGFDVLLDAFAAAVRDGLEARLVIMGEGPERAALEAAVAQRGLGHRVQLPGFVADAPSYLPLFDVLVLPSRSEGLPMTLLEALRAEVPVVATRVGGVPAVLDEGRRGLLVPPGDARALADGIRMLVCDRVQASAMAAAGRRAVAEHFTSARMAERYVALYRDALHGRTPRLSKPTSRP
jgi:glycosyltransferase involved in cell wall biosynthesis